MESNNYTLKTTGDNYTTNIAKCYNCEYSEVCKYKDKYHELLNEIIKQYNHFDTTDTFSLKLDCKHFKDNNYVSLGGSYLNGGITNVNPCKEVLGDTIKTTGTNEDYKLRGVDPNECTGKEYSNTILGNSYIDSKDLKNVSIESNSGIGGTPL
jgi:hypothetical protein